MSGTGRTVQRAHMHTVAMAESSELAAPCCNGSGGPWSESGLADLVRSADRRFYGAEMQGCSIQNSGRDSVV